MTITVSGDLLRNSSCAVTATVGKKWAKKSACLGSGSLRAIGPIRVDLPLLRLPLIRLIALVDSQAGLFGVLGASIRRCVRSLFLKILDDTVFDQRFASSQR